MSTLKDDSMQVILNLNTYGFIWLQTYCITDTVMLRQIIAEHKRCKTMFIRDHSNNKKYKFEITEVPDN